ncbi:endo alpha-1,4 polygalactosaminidase [Microbulbifer sp. CNSA002]|uniref:endo alpha-1,4 polygalactosaminidase n=1 Tax=Microbulbifer sp. CNSA002 TaxID=3373604 RepID=UPI0039B4104B
MRRILIAALSPLLIFGCSLDDLPDDLNQSTIKYDKEMRYLVEDISAYAKDINRHFLIVPQNGVELITTTTTTTGPIDEAYLDATDGIAQEALFFGANGDINEPTSESETERLQTYLDLAKDEGDTILITDFTNIERDIDESYENNEEAGYISFAADNELLNDIPLYPDEPFNVNSLDIDDLEEAKNYINITNTSNYSTPQDFIDALSETDYDILIIDFFFDGEPYTEEQIEQLKEKENGGRRLVLAYVNIGEAQDDRYYWKSYWYNTPPEWLLGEVPGEPGNYYVKYWQQGWQKIIFGNDDSYIYMIVDAGFDGAYMDGIDAFEYFDSDDE